MEYKTGKAWGYLILIAVGAIPAIAWITLAGYLEETACEGNSCDRPQWADRQFWIALAAVAAWLLAMLGGWLDRRLPLVGFATLAAGLTIAWLAAVAAL